MNTIPNKKNLKKTNSQSSVNSIHYYDSVLVVEKRERKKPKDVVSGNLSFSGNVIKDYKPNIKPYFKNKYHGIFKRILRIFNF